MSSRNQILQRLKQTTRPYTDSVPVKAWLPMVPIADPQPESLRHTFVEQAQKLNCTVQVCNSTDDALQRLWVIIGEDRSILSWDLNHIPLPGLGDALQKAGIHIAQPDDASVRVGLTGVDAALAGTGSLVLTSGPGKSRLVSLLPFVHVAVLAADQILPNFESWAEQERATGLDKFRAMSNVLVISGPSRTADIAMELVLGAHGPAEVHILIVTGRGA